MEPAIQINEKKLSLIKRYPMEVLVVVLLLAVVYVISRQGATENKVDKLQDEMKAYLQTDRIKTVDAIFNNTETMRNTNNLLIDIKYTLQNTLKK